MKNTHVVDVDTTEIRVVLPGQHVDAQTGRRVAVTVDGAGRTSFAIASRPVAHVHHACTTHGQTKGEIEKKRLDMFIGTPQTMQSRVSYLVKFKYRHRVHDLLCVSFDSSISCAIIRKRKDDEDIACDEPRFLFLRPNAG